MKGAPSQGRRLALLLSVGAITSVDYQALGITLQSIKTDLRLSDTELGVLSGIAFALFYSVMGVPLARWADRGHRVRVIACSTALYGAAVALCGVAGNFVELLLIRIGVAVGEAGYLPAANSLLADYFSRAERPRALAVSMLGSPLSVLIGDLLVGWLNQLYGWRRTFELIGVPAIAVAVMTWWLLDEPREGRSAGSGDRAIAGEPERDIVASRAVRGDAARCERAVTSPSLQEVASTLWGKRTFRHVLYGFSVLSFFGGGIAQWQPAFLIRSFHLQTGAVGAWLTLTYGLGGALGLYGGGQWASRWAARNERRQLGAIASGCAVAGVASALTYGAPNVYWAFGFMTLTAIGGATVSAPLFAVLQTLIPERMRAVAVALTYLVANLIGMGVGPLLVGAVSDGLRPALGDESLRFALLAMSPGFAWAGWHLWRARRSVDEELRMGEASG